MLRICLENSQSLEGDLLTNILGAINISEAPSCDVVKAAAAHTAQEE